MQRLIHAQFERQSRRLLRARPRGKRTFDKDKPGVSNCAGDCAKLWPPLTAPADAKAEGKLSVIAREDGTKQWAYDGAPLYTFAKDAAKGDKTGDGVKGVWHIARP